MKDKFIKNGVFSLEYDKETLRDMVLELQEENQELKAELQLYQGALKREHEAIHRANKAIEYIKEKYDYILGDDTFLDHDEIIDKKQIIHILELLEDKEVE